MNTNMTTEPARIMGIAGGIIVAVIPLLARTFGWSDALTDDWRLLFESLVPLIGVLLTAEAIRRKVYSQETYEADVAAALHQDPPPED